MNICVFCSANELGEEYVLPAKKLAKLLANAGHNLVWGGSNAGLMKVMADSVQNEGGKIIGVSMELLKDFARQDADEMIIAKDLHQRKAILLERADVIVTLVGGFGTLDETTEAIELKKHSQHNKEIIILNTNGFYDGLKQQLNRMDDEKLLPVKELAGIKARTLLELVQFAETPEEVMQFITATPSIRHSSSHSNS